MAVQSFRKKPVVIEAVQWDGENFTELHAFTEGRFRHGDPDTGADPQVLSWMVFDTLHSTWVRVFPGQWVIKGVKGEFYPCADDVLAQTYEPVEG